MEENIHPNFDALSEAEFMERRMVFMGEEESAGDAPAEGAPVAAEAPAEGSRSQGAEAKKQTDGINFILDKLETPTDPISRGVTKSLLADVKIEEVKYGSGGTTIESVKASYRNIETTIESDTPKEDLDKFTEFTNKLKEDKYKKFKFADGSKVDIKDKKIYLRIDVKATLVDTPPRPTLDELLISISMTDNKITEATLIDESGRTIVQSLIDQTIDAIDLAKLRELAATAEPDVEAAVAAVEEGEVEAAEDGTASADGEEVAEELPAEEEAVPLTGEMIITPDQYKDKFKKAFKAFQKGKTDSDVFGITFLVEDKKKQIATIRFEHSQGDDFDEFKITRTGIDGREFVFPIFKDPEGKDGKVSLNSPGDGGKLDDLTAKINDDGTITLEKTDDVSGAMKITIDILYYMMQIEGDNRGMTFKSERIPIDPAINTFEVVIDGKKGRLTINEDGGFTFTPNGPDTPLEPGAEGVAAEGGDTDKDQDKKRRSALERTFGREASENIGSFMETLEELAAVVLELLESLGFDLNGEKSKDGTTRTPAEREGRRLWLFIVRNQLGTKNRGKLQSMRMDDLMALYHDKDQARTMTALEEAEFDTDGVHGEKLYEMLEHIHDIKDEDDANREDGKGKEAVKAYFVANESRMDLNTFLFNTKMIDMNGRWSDGWEEFDGKTDAEKAEKAAAEAVAEATKAQERTSLKNDTTLKPEVMKRIVNADKPDERNALAKKLQDMGVLTDTAAITAYDKSGKTPDGFRTLLDTMSNDDKEEFFGDADAVEGKWRDVKVELKKIIPPGSTDADRLAERLMGETTKLKLGDTEITFAEEGKLAKKLKQTVLSYDGQPFVEAEGTKADLMFSGDSFGLRPDEVATLFKYLHNPEDGNYTDSKTSLGKVYALPAGSKHTLADLMVAVFDIKLGEEAPDAEPA